MTKIIQYQSPQFSKHQLIMMIKAYTRPDIKNVWFITGAKIVIWAIVSYKMRYTYLLSVNVSECRSVSTPILNHKKMHMRAHWSFIIPLCILLRYVKFCYNVAISKCSFGDILLNQINLVMREYIYE